MLQLFFYLFLFSGVLAGQDYYPIEDVRAGQQATGLTVFSGTQIEKFDVEILGVLDSVAPKQSVILGRLSGGPLADTGVMSGMSGSPIYIDGRLAGAVAFMYPFSTEPLAGIRPIHEILAGFETDSAEAVLPAVDTLDEWRVLAGLPRKHTVIQHRPSQIQPISTPVSMSGFSPRTLDVFGDKFEQLGLRPVQGAGGGLRDDIGGAVEPGSMISVGLIHGDMKFSAAGTVTHVENDRVFAFGHRFLSSGTVDWPMMRASVLTLVPNLNASFKLSGTGEMAGRISLDRSSGISGELGPEPDMIPCRIQIRSVAGDRHDYQIQVVRGSMLTPFLLQIALFAVIDASERTFGPLSLRVSGGATFRNGLPRLVLDDIYSGVAGVGQVTALSTVVPLSFLLQSGFLDVAIEAVDLTIDASPRDEYSDLVRGWVSKGHVSPGETINVHLVSKDPDGVEHMRTLPYTVPVSMPAGQVQITVADAQSINITRFRGLLAGRRVRDAGDMIHFLNSLRGSDKAYLRVWENKQSLWLHSEQLPAPPASMKAVLATPAGRGVGAVPERSSPIHEQVLVGFRGVVRGRLNLQFVVRGG